MISKYTISINILNAINIQMKEREKDIKEIADKMKSEMGFNSSSSVYEMKETKIMKK